MTSFGLVELPKEFEEKSELNKEVEPENPMKEWLVNYVGEKHTPENGQVTVEMIVEVVAKEFPEFIFALAEENFFRGYQQAMTDVFESTDTLEKMEKASLEIYENEKRKRCKLCEKQE